MYESLTDLFVVEKGPKVGIFFKKTPTWFKGWVNPKNPEDPYSPEVWTAFEMYIDSTVQRELQAMKEIEARGLTAREIEEEENSEAFPSFETEYKGGRYGLSRRLREHGSPVLRQMSLGQLSHLVQLGISKGILTYEHSTLQPAAAVALGLGRQARLAKQREAADEGAQGGPGGCGRRHNHRRSNRHSHRKFHALHAHVVSLPERCAKHEHTTTATPAAAVATEALTTDSSPPPGLLTTTPTTTAVPAKHPEEPTPALIDISGGIVDCEDCLADCVECIALCAECSTPPEDCPGCQDEEARQRSAQAATVDVDDPEVFERFSAGHLIDEMGRKLPLCGHEHACSSTEHIHHAHLHEGDSDDDSFVFFAADIPPQRRLAELQKRLSCLLSCRSTPLLLSQVRLMLERPSDPSDLFSPGHFGYSKLSDVLVDKCANVCKLFRSDGRHVEVHPAHQILMAPPSTAVAKDANGITVSVCQGASCTEPHVHRVLEPVLLSTQKTRKKPGAATGAAAATGGANGAGEDAGASAPQQQASCP